MSKSRVCPESTQQTCAKKTNLLVYEREKGASCKPQPKTYVPPISSPQVKRIKICTGAELKKMCAPPPCPCPPKIPRPTLLQRLARLIGLGAKSLAALGAVYVTYDMGIWGDSETTGDLYKCVCNFIVPSLVEPSKERPLSSACKAELELFNMFEKDPYCCDKFPIDTESNAYKLQQKWNKIVINSFSAIAGFPATVRNWSHQLYCKIVEDESCKEVKAGEEGELECCPCD